MKTLFRDAFNDVFGENDDRSTTIPAGSALIYMIRRFGYTTDRSDELKRLCKYLIPTDVQGFCVELSFTATLAWFRWSIVDTETESRHGIYQEISLAEHHKREAWEKEAKKWGESQGITFFPKYDVTDSDTRGEWWEKNKHLFPQSTKWTHDDDWRPVQDAFRDFCYTSVDSWNTSCALTVEAGFPMLDYHSPKYYSDLVVQCAEAYKATLENLLVPTTINSSFINILGGVDGVPENYIEPYHGSGHGVPQMYHDDPQRFYKSFGNSVTIQRQKGE